MTDIKRTKITIERDGNTAVFEGDVCVLVIAKKLEDGKMMPDYFFVGTYEDLCRQTNFAAAIIHRRYCSESCPHPEKCNEDGTMKGEQK